MIAPLPPANEPVDWATTFHAVQYAGGPLEWPAKGALCSLCGAPNDKAIHSESYARSQGHPFLNPVPRADPAALTDEELAKMQTKHVRSSWGGGMCLRDEMFWPCDALQLIAALRASRAEVDEWQMKYDGAIEAVRTNRLRAEAAEAEVERLKQHHREMHDPLA